MRSTSGLHVSPRLRLTAARLERRWSQRVVADRIGTTTLNVSRWERGLTKPGPYFRPKLCALFGKSEQELDLESAAASSAAVPLVTEAVKDDVCNDPTIPLLSTASLTGRDRELAMLRQRFCTDDSEGLVALCGLPGAGKTTLAIALAHDNTVRRWFQDGILWAALGPKPNLGSIYSRWAELLDLSRREIAGSNNYDAWSIKLHQAIGSRKILLVLDDAWSIEAVLALKVGGIRCAYLVTTRFPNIAAALAPSAAMAVGELGEEESIHLLRTLAPRVVDIEEQKAHDLVRTVGGLPLALTLIGRYLRVTAMSGQPRRITTALERLNDTGERLGLAEPQKPTDHHPSLPAYVPLSLQAVFAVSEAHLDAQARAAFYALSVLPAKPNSFSEEAALYVAACEVEALDALFDAGLLESSSPGRYSLHQVAADYAHLHLEGTAASNRLVNYCTDFVETHKKDYELLERESAVILTALDAAYELGRHTTLVRCTCAFAPYLVLSGVNAVVQQHIQRAYEVALTLGDDYGIATTLLYLGQIALRQGDYAQAETRYREGLALAREMGNAERTSALLAELGAILWKRGEYGQSEAYLQEGLTLARQIGDIERISGLLETLGTVVAGGGDYALSEKYLREGLELARKIGDREQICTLLINLGVTAGEQGNSTQEEAYYLEGLILARQIKHREWISLLLMNLGEVVAEKGEHEQAETYFQEGLLLARQIEHREWISVLLLNLGTALQKQRNDTLAEAYLQESLTLARHLGIPQIVCNALYEYGNLLLSRQQIDAADTTFREMLATVPIGGQDLLALANYGLARTAAAQGNIDEARRLGEASASVLGAIGHRKKGEVENWMNQFTLRARLV